MKVLVALDGSSGSDVVLQKVEGRPWPEGTQFCLFTALDPFFFTKAPLLLEQAKKTEQESLEEAAEQVKKTNRDVSIEVVVENPRHAIPALARAWKADWILIGSHGRGAFARLLLGSTAQYVLRHATCSVEIVRHVHHEKTEEKPGALRILIPTDGSECALTALRSVAERPWPEGTVCRVISTPEVPIFTADYPYYEPNLIREAITSNEAHAKDAVDQGLKIMKARGLNAIGEVTQPKESAVRAILSLSDEWQADLIVLGSHGRRGLDRFLLGSVSEAVALHAHCSVGVVRQTEQK